MPFKTCANYSFPILVITKRIPIGIAKSTTIAVLSTNIDGSLTIVNI